jgi:ubiquinone/menaquinone biosynthesis C-methylase UbiE
MSGSWDKSMHDAKVKHNQTVIEQFSKQAVAFAEMPGHSDSMQMLIKMSGVSGGDQVLDVACGPGLVACAFAPHARQVTGIDITPGMIEQARGLQGKKQLENLTWQVGNVLPLPFPEASFSVVLTRYSFHHFLNPEAVLAEMVRVCRKGGRVMVADVVLPPEKAGAYNRMERLRDPSHIRALTYPEMVEIVGASGLTNVQTGHYKVEMELEKQLSASFPNPGDADRIRRLFEADLGVDDLGVGAHRQGAEIHFAYPIWVVVGEKSA